MKALLFAGVVLAVISGCEQIRRNGRPGEPGYIAPRVVQVKMIHFEPELVQEVGSAVAHRQAYSVIQDGDGTRYRVPGNVGPVGESFKMDVSLLKAIGAE